MKIKITPSHLKGSVTPPSSKSVFHRALIAAALAKGESKIFPCAFSDDVTATMQALRALGAAVAENGESIIVKGIESIPDTVYINAGESGSTLRFLIPVCAALAKRSVFSGRGRLPQRPLSPYYEVLAKYSKKSEAELPLEVENGFKTTHFEIDGSVSSQFVTGLLMTLPFLGENASIIVKGELKSAPYVEITKSVMSAFGVDVICGCAGYNTYGQYTAREFKAETDWSAAAFWFAADMLGAQIEVCGLDILSAQGDKKIVDIIETAGGEITENKKGFSVCSAEYKDGDSRCIEIDISQIPDLAPPIAAMAAAGSGKTIMKNASALRAKESDRIESISSALKLMGADVEVIGDDIHITGKKQLKGGVCVPSFGDHRIAMMTAVASIKCEKPVVIEDAECVKKSYPRFFEDFRALGGIADEFYMGW